MGKMCGKFLEGAKRNGIDEKKAAHTFELMEHFAGYGFNKSHSTAYALLAYQTAYLKANYPWQFAAALLTIESANTDVVPRGVPRPRHSGASAGPQREPAGVYGHPRGRPIRPDGDQECRRRGDSVAPRRAGEAGAGPHRLAARTVRGPRPAPGQQTGVRKPDQGGRVRFDRDSRSIARGGRAGGFPAAADCRDRSGYHRTPCGRGCGPTAKDPWP